MIEAQGHQVQENTVYQDNTSAMKLEINGKTSSGKRTRHFDIKFCYFTDLVNREEIQVKYCPTKKMIADFITKLLVRSTYVNLGNQILDAG